MASKYGTDKTLTKSNGAQGVLSSRQVDLASLIPQDSIDASMRISTLDGWQKIEQLGQGTFGEVWKYSTPLNGIPIAAGKHLKVQLWNLSDKQKVDLQNRVNSFISEFNMLYKVSSECSARFVQFIKCYMDSKKLILFTECMPNGSIKDHIIENPLNEPTALKYTFQAAEGLKFLHHYKPDRIVHRDIKCDNLLLTREFNVKLADFGLAYNLAVDNESYTMSQGAPCGVAGTVIFAAPEVLLDTTKYGRRADIWSLGCTLVEMLTCQPPHADFWHKHKERAQFLFLEQARADPPNQLQYNGRLLVPKASSSVQKLLDCLFIKNEINRPTSDHVLSVFVCDSSAQVRIDAAKLAELQSHLENASSPTKVSK